MKGFGYIGRVMGFIFFPPISEPNMNRLIILYPNRPVYSTQPGFLCLDRVKLVGLTWLLIPVHTPKGKGGENIGLLAKVGGLLIKLGGLNFNGGFDENFEWLMFSYQEGLCG